MKTFMLIFSFFISYNNLFAGSVCENLNNSSLPPTPHQNGYLRFDGRGDFLRTNDLEVLEFQSSATDSILIKTKIKIRGPFCPQFIFGKYGVDRGWIFGYHTYQSGYVSFSFSYGWKNIYYLGADTNWHEYEIRYIKQTRVLSAFVDGNLTYTYPEFTYGDISNVGAFSVGNAGFLPQYGSNSVNLYTMWFKGDMDYLSVKVNGKNIVNYNFDECAGQVARDSASFHISDRVYPGVSFCGSAHFMLGYMPSQDTCDPLWVSGNNPLKTGFSPLGSGMQYWHSGEDGEYFAEHFSLALTVWNGYLINGGKFNRAGGNVAEHIAKWDGSSWSPLGSGLNHEVVFLASYQNDLYATGFFDTAYSAGETKHIAKWNGTSWSSIGGLDNVGTVMAVYNSELIVGGSFTIAGNVAARGIARWDGSTWRPMQSGMTGTVWALCEYNGELYAGGSFESAGTEICNSIAKWNGSSWAPVGRGISGGDNLVYVLKTYNGDLYAGGGFINMDGKPCYNIARYDRSNWYPVGSGAKGLNCIPSQGHIIDMQVYKNELYVIGQFTSIAGVAANKIAKWNGTNWCGIEYGADLRPEDLEVYHGDLILNGDFFSISGTEYSNIAKYNSGSNSIGINNNQTVAENYRLYQNYPNPFNPSSKIKFQISKLSDARFIVFDALGKEVETLVNGQLKPGTYEVEFNGRNLSAGIYFYKLEAVESTRRVVFTDTKKMVLIK